MTGAEPVATIAFDAATVTAETTTILRPTTLTLTEQRIAIIGANGSGKSTLARLINGLVRPSSGSVSVDGTDTSSHGRAVRRRVGFVFTDPESQLVMPTVSEDIALSLRRTGVVRGARRTAALDILRRYGLHELADVSVHALSGGQKQLLAIAGVLATEPDVLVADEPTTLLDLRNANRVAELLFGLRQQLVLVTHDLGLAERCERVLVVDAGVIAYDGRPPESIAHYRKLVAQP